MTGDISTITKSIPCSDCFELVEVPILVMDGREMFNSVVCDSCHERIVARRNQDAAENRQKSLSCSFESICPPLYRESDLKRLHGAFSEAVQNWTYSPTGLLFQGSPGRGKTRAAWWLLRREHFAGRSVFGLSSTEFGRLTGEQWHDDSTTRRTAETTLARCRATSLLLLDDLGKQKMTERAQTELYDLLESRTNNLLPTIVTTNSTGEQLREMFSEDKAKAILRRIVEFSILVKQ